MNWAIAPTTLHADGLRLEPLQPHHEDGLRAAACDGTPDGDIPEHAACHLYQQDWGIPFTVDPAAPAELTLELRGTD